LLCFTAIGTQAALYKLSSIKGNMDDAERLQKLFNLPQDFEKSVSFDLEGAELHLDRAVEYKKIHNRITSIIGNGAIIHLDKPDAAILPSRGRNMKVGLGNSPDDIMAHFDTFRISDTRFYGKNVNKALLLVGTYQSRIERCGFYGIDYPLELIFCLQAIVEHCEFNKNINGLTIRSGASIPENASQFPAWFSNGNVSNSCSNRTQVRDCRFYSYQNSETLLRIDASDGVQVSNCIFEGFNPIYAVYMESRNSPTVPSFYLENCHFEFVTYAEGTANERTTKALIKAHAQVIVELKGIYSQYGRCTQIEADAVEVIVERPAYLPLGPGGLKAGKSSGWKFIELHNDPDVLFDPLTWDNQIPSGLILERHGSLIGDGYTWNIENRRDSTALILNNNRIKLQGEGVELMLGAERWIDTYNQLEEGQDLSGFEVGKLIPISIENADGKVVTAYLPYLVRKPRKK
jgi:hypothetical protein